MIAKQTDITVGKHRMFAMNYEVYESPAELVRVLESRENVDKHGDGDMLARRKLRENWHGVQNSKEALDLCANGWSVKTPEIKRLTKEVQKRIPAHTQKMVPGVCGFAPIVPLALAGSPTSMLTSIRLPRNAKTIDLYYDMTLSFILSAEDLLDMGMAVCEAVMRLEASGYRVRLSMMQSYTDNLDGDALIVRIKREDQPFNIEKMAFPLFNPAAFRVLGFAWEDRCPTCPHRSGRGRGLGYSRSDEELDAIAKEMFGKNAIMVSASNMHAKHGLDGAKIATAIEGTVTG